MNENYHVRSQGPVVVIELRSRSFNAFCEALKVVETVAEKRRILLIQSVEKEGSPFQIVIVFEWEKEDRA
jgi:hypothetical protein